MNIEKMISSLVVDAVNWSMVLIQVGAQVAEWSFIVFIVWLLYSG